MKRFISIWYDLFPKIRINIARDSMLRHYDNPTSASLARVVRLMNDKNTNITVMSNYVNLWQSHDKETA